MNGTIGIKTFLKRPYIPKTSQENQVRKLQLKTNSDVAWSDNMPLH